MKPSVVTVAVLTALACSSPSPTPSAPPGTPLNVSQANERGPRIPAGTIFAAADLTTMRALIDAADSGMAGKFGGATVTHECLPPYTTGTDTCWPDQASSPGRSYLVLEGQGGFCEVQDGPPQLSVSGTNIVLQFAFTDESGCRINGVVAAPSAGLLWFRSDRLKPGLYAVSYVVRHSSDTYRSAATYLSLPGPAPGTPAEMDREATAALTSVVGLQRGIFSLARVDGAQLGTLCGETVAGPAYLVTYETNPPRQMTTALASSTPRTCVTSKIGP